MGKLQINGGLKVQGRVNGSGDDEGIVIDYADNNWAGLILGSPSAKRSAFYLSSSGLLRWRYNDGSNSYDITHPSKSGTIALISDIPTTMAWSNITGKPSTFTPSSHTHNYIEAKGTYTFTSSTLPNSFDLGISAGFVNSDSGFGSYGSVLTVRTFSGGGGSLQLYAPYSSSYGGTHLKARFGNYASSSGNSWTDLKELAWLSDLNNYLPLSGGTITSTNTSDTPLRIQSGDLDSYIAFIDKNGTYLGYYGVNSNKQPVFYDTADRVILHSNNYSSYALPKSGGTLTGNLTITETKNILLRPNNSSYTAGIGYDTSGNECIALWAKNAVTRLRWYAGTDMSNMAAGTMMNITSDFEISKASGTAIGYIGGNTILHSGNYSSYCAPASHSHSYVPLSGGTMTGKLQVNSIIFGYNYTNTSNAAAFMFDKPGSYFTGIGANGSSDTIQFGPCNADGTWVTNHAQHWTFRGTIRPGCIILTNDQWTGYGTSDPNDLNLDKVVGRLYFKI